MRVKKRFLSAVLLTAMVCASLSGCGDKTTTTTSDDVSVSVSATDGVSDIVEYNTIAPPEDGWTEEQLGQVTYFCGKQISIPSDFSDLYFYDDLKVDESEIMEVPDNADYYYEYNGQIISKVKYYHIYRNNDNIADLTCLITDDSQVVCSIDEFNFDSDKANLLYVNSISISNDLDEIINMLGEKYTYQENNHFYRYNCQGNDNVEIAFRCKSNKPSVLGVSATMKNER